jgi:hypothetical protein
MVLADFENRGMAILRLCVARPGQYVDGQSRRRPNAQDEQAVQGSAGRLMARLKGSSFHATHRSMLTDICKAAKSRRPVSLPGACGPHRIRISLIFLKISSYHDFLKLPVTVLGHKIRWRPRRRAAPPVRDVPSRLDLIRLSTRRLRDVQNRGGYQSEARHG